MVSDVGAIRCVQSLVWLPVGDRFTGDDVTVSLNVVLHTRAWPVATEVDMTVQYARGGGPRLDSSMVRY